MFHPVSKEKKVRQAHSFDYKRDHETKHYPNYL